MMKRIFFKVSTLLLVVSMLFVISGCSTQKTVSQLEPPKEGEEIAIIHTNKGDISIKFFPDAAPLAVENFITHSKNGYYNGLIFHRVINDFMIQGGDPEGTGFGGESIWGDAFKDEFNVNARNYRGALSMANSGTNTNKSQFFIVQASKVDDSLITKMQNSGKDGGFTEDVIENYKTVGGTPWLDFVHTVFGQVFDGMDIVDSIAGVEVDENSKPLEDVIINSVEITTYKTGQ